MSKAPKAKTEAAGEEKGGGGEEGPLGETGHTRTSRFRFFAGVSFTSTAAPRLLSLADCLRGPASSSRARFGRRAGCTGAAFASASSRARFFAVPELLPLPLPLAEEAGRPSAETASLSSSCSRSARLRAMLASRSSSLVSAEVR